VTSQSDSAEPANTSEHGAPRRDRAYPTT